MQNNNIAIQNVQKLRNNHVEIHNFVKGSKKINILNLEYSDEGN
jgi:hypothetical protein